MNQDFCLKGLSCETEMTKSDIRCGLEKMHLFGFSRQLLLNLNPDYINPVLSGWVGGI
jgi:hypothetical protein